MTRREDDKRILALYIEMRKMASEILRYGGTLGTRTGR